MNAAAASPRPHNSELCSEEPDSLASESEKHKQCNQVSKQQLLRSPQAKAELKVVKPVSPKKETVVQKKQPDAGRQQSFSAFSFLYYLFYKFNAQDFTATPNYSAEGEISQPSAW